ncbi:protein RRNAD1 [Lingula anatina]|uniref:Protein RRNAD1 n=1 Tax=Lingula anatina TaxID=7574 RepID=A0A1S3HHZ4_LINAN|nr:protein RRNAD1 [Lingula anatina]|eukprot:XP_013385101.1 protein RRNAD1 [Lingula anatina]
MKSVICCKDTVAEIRIWLLQAVRLIDQYRWMVDSYVSDFFVDRKWDKLNNSWKATLEQLQPDELVSLLDANKQDSRHVWPLSLLAYKATTQALSLPRKPLSADELRKRLSTCQSQSTCTSDFQQTSAAGCQKTEISNGQCLSLDHCYRRHVKPKKQHEIQGLAQVVSLLSISCQCSRVVDVGAGHGHLSRLLAFGHGLDVTALEAASVHAPKAQTFDKEVVKDIFKAEKRSKEKDEETPSSLTSGDLLVPHHVVCRIEPDISVQGFLSVIKESRSINSPGRISEQLSPLPHPQQPEPICQNIVSSFSYYIKTDGSSEVYHSTSSEDKQKAEDQCKAFTKKDDSASNRSDECTGDDFMLTGLHACGDLSSTLLRLFIQCSECVALASVACCYMKLSCGNPIPGYPMSSIVSSISGHQMSWEARELACHFVDCYIQRLKGNSPALRTHCYRAVAQQFILGKKPNFQHGRIKLTVKNSHQMPVDRYIKEVLKKLGLDDQLSEEQIRKAQVQVNDWKSVVIFYVLRLALAPVVESVILLDRMLYLWEQGADSYLLAIFDPLLSPRNFVLVAHKR